ncbi:MAG TPA: hypothetical protein VIM64_24315 [Puia sp.]
MPRPYFILLASLVLSCVRQEIRSPAIRDFRPSLQTGLIAAVAEAHVGYEGAYFIRQNATDCELIQLSYCEHPILRAYALAEMTHRPSFDHMKVMLEHLDDTAKIFVDHGEWGLEIRTVSDNMIENGRWKTPADRQRLIDEILRHHHTLRSAFTCLWHVDTAEKYYGSLKEMVVQDRDYTEREQALYALAKCRRAEDIPLIKDILLSNTFMMSSRSFDLMKNFPDTAYIEVLKKYFRRMNRLICDHQSVDPAVAFIRTLGAYKNDSCALLLEKLFLRTPLAHCNVDTFSLRGALVKAIYDNPCPAYAGLRELARPYWRSPSQPIALPGDSSVVIEKKDEPEPVRW